MSNYLKWKGAMISQDVAHRLVTDTQISTWDSKANGSHTHTKSEITDFPSSLKNPNSIKIQLNSGTKEGTNMFTYDGSGAKTINITIDAIGAAAAFHEHCELITGTTLSMPKKATNNHILYTSNISKELITAEKCGFNASDNSNAVLTLSRHVSSTGSDGSSIGYYAQLGFSSDTEMYYRSKGNVESLDGVAWYKIMHSGNLDTYLNTYCVDAALTPTALSVPYAGSTGVSKFTKETFTSYKSYIGSATDKDDRWYNILSIRHRNGKEDGTKYGLLIRSSLTDAGSITYWKQTGESSWTEERTIVDSANVRTYAASPDHGHSTIAYLNPTNVTGGTKADTITYWSKKGVGLFNFATEGMLVGQPSQYGNLLNLSRDTEVSQLWFKQSNGDVAHRQGNATGWSGKADNTVSRWVTFLDSNNFTNYAAAKSHTHAEIANLDNTYLKLSGGTVTGSISPSVSGAASLGSAHSYWNTLYASSAYISSIYSTNKSLSLSLLDTNITLHKDLDLVGNKLIFGNVNKTYADGNSNLIVELRDTPTIFTQKSISIYKGDIDGTSNRMLLINTDDNNIKIDTTLNASNIIPNNTACNLGSINNFWSKGYFTKLYTREIESTLINYDITSTSDTDGITFFDTKIFFPRLADTKSYAAGIIFKSNVFNASTDNNGSVSMALCQYANNLHLNGAKTLFDFYYNKIVVDTSVLPSTNGAYDLGSEENRWGNAYINKIYHNDGTLAIYFNIRGEVRISKPLTIGGDCIPYDDRVFNLGMDGRRWATVYTKNLYTDAMTTAADKVTFNKPTNLITGGTTDIGEGAALQTGTLYCVYE